MALIEDVMKTELVTVEPQQSVLEAANRMDRNGVGAVLVAEPGPGGLELRGLFSERDLLRRVVVEGRDPSGTRVDAVMTTDVIQVAPDTHVRKCAELIRDYGVRHLPVVRDGQAIGVLSTRDFQDHLVRGLESFIDQMQYREALAEGIDPYDHFGGGYT